MLPNWSGPYLVIFGAQLRVAYFGQAFLFLDADGAVGRKAFDRERPGHADPLGVLVGLVVEHFGIGPAGDRGVDLLLPPRRSSHHCFEQLLGVGGPSFSGSPGISHSSHSS